MFIRANKRRKNGKPHTYYNVVENRRLADGRSVQRQVLYLGEINAQQEDSWRRALQVFDPVGNQTQTMSLFTAPEMIPSEQVNSLAVCLNQMTLRHPRSYGDCWLGCQLWQDLKLDEFWNKRLVADGRSGVSWEKVLALLVINRLIDPGSEFRLHRQWFDRSAMDELLEVDASAASKDRLYRCLDRILEHRSDLFQHLQQRWKDLLEQLGAIQMIDVHLPATDGRCLVMPRHTEPEPEQQLLLDKLELHLPEQPPPRIYASQMAALAPRGEVQ